MAIGQSSAAARRSHRASSTVVVPGRRPSLSNTWPARMTPRPPVARDACRRPSTSAPCARYSRENPSSAVLDTAATVLPPTAAVTPRP